MIQSMKRTRTSSTSSEPRAWVLQPSGKRLDLISPTPFDWEDSDLAVGVARTFRWGGHSIWPLPLSVAQHSLFVLQLHRASGKVRMGSELRELLHDAEEGLVGFDPISPLKPILGQEFRNAMERLQRAVFLRYGVPAWTKSDHVAHKRIDILAAASEAVHVAGWSVQDVKKVLKIRLMPLAIDPLIDIYGGNAWEPWPVEVATERFLTELNGLLEQQ